MRSFVALTEYAAYAAQCVSSLRVWKHLVVCVQSVRQGNDADIHLRAILDEEHHVVEVAEHIVERVKHGTVATCEAVNETTPVRDKK